ncbi:hypothetical protein HZH66_006614 [Vespula vulgaris]|uniref:Uncharacterized protein n=1 Tax=Vespula vulgaris TaxID=7454 RepID=A0A834N755_VESVU|nr:hypothetical protein HZH66_006614 [Vespula vulgaris]
MLPANVMSFMKKMVTTQSESGTTGAVTPEESGTTFSKLRQLGSGLMMVTGNGVWCIIMAFELITSSDIPR